MPKFDIELATYFAWSVGEIVLVLSAISGVVAWRIMRERCVAARLGGRARWTLVVVVPLLMLFLGWREFVGPLVLRRLLLSGDRDGALCVISAGASLNGRCFDKLEPIAYAYQKNLGADFVMQLIRRGASIDPIRDYLDARLRFAGLFHDQEELSIWQPVLELGEQYSNS